MKRIYHQINNSESRKRQKIVIDNENADFPQINNLESIKHQKIAINNGYVAIINNSKLNAFDNFDLLNNIQMNNLTLDEMDILRKILDKKIRKYMQKIGDIEQILNIYL